MQPLVKELTGARDQAQRRADLAVAPRGLLRIVAVPAAIVALGAAGGLAAAYLNRAVPPARVQAAAAAPLPVAPVGPAAPQPAPVTPTFDIVRVSPGGGAVIAGRAEPGARVVVRDGAQEVGQTSTDSHGAWVLIPSAPLRSGGRELTLASRMPGAPEVQGDSVLLSIPAAPAAVAAAEPPPVALLVPRDGPARVLGAPAVPGAAPTGKAGLALGSVDYDDRGDIRFAGTAPPNTPVRVYVDNAPAGDATADLQGRWTLAPQAAIAAGLHKLRVDQITAAGRVAARVELPFLRSSLPAAELAGGRMVVQPGQNLWRMARAAYGNGVRYTVIYLANREQIRDPKLIYPGQAFAVPAPPS